MTKKRKQNREWHIFDAREKRLGRLSTAIANVLRGKNKPQFRSNFDIGDYAIVVNAKEVALSGKKEEQKIYYHHSGYLGNLKSIDAKTLRLKKPEELIRRAVFGMLPDNRLRDNFMKRLKIYADEKHPHKSQIL